MAGKGYLIDEFTFANTYARSDKVVVLASSRAAAAFVLCSS
jgi:hypothetical protein